MAPGCVCRNNLVIEPVTRTIRAPFLIRAGRFEERSVLLLHFDRPMNRLGRFANALLMSVIRKTPFVKHAIRNHKLWEDRFRKQLAAAGVQIS
jgi:hypothetical protein